MLSESSESTETYQFKNFQKPCWCAEDVGVEGETHGGTSLKSKKKFNN